MRWLIPLVALASIAHAQPQPRAADKAEADRLVEADRQRVDQGA